jgi:hypothetical protein
MGGLLCGCGGGVAVLLVAALLLRLATSVTNKMLGGPARAEVRPRSRGGIPEWDWDDWDDEDVPAQRPRRGRGGVPAAGFGTCVVSAFLTALVFGLAFILLGFAAEENGLRMRHVETRLAIAIVALPIAYLTLTVMLILLLPTTFWRAAMVAFVYGLFILGLVVAVGAFVFAVEIVFD